MNLDGHGPADPMALIAEAAELLEDLPAAQLEELRELGSDLAGNLDAPPAVRRCGAWLEGSAEGAAKGLVDWDYLLAMGVEMNTIRRNNEKRTRDGK